MDITLVNTPDEIRQIYEMCRANLKKNLSAEQRAENGFVSWEYNIPLLEQINALAPSVIAKDGDTVAGYALTTLAEARAFHPDLDELFVSLKGIPYHGRPLESYRFYVMGQICVDRKYRGRNLVKMMYDKHREVYRDKFELLVTEISTSNGRSDHVHKKVGFETIKSYRDAKDEWKIVAWDWR